MKRMKKIFARFVRILTAPPIFAALLCVFLYLLLPGNFASPVHFALALGFLTGLPLLAYPIAALIPALRRKGRDGQRDLAVVFSVIGYVGGFLYALLFDGAATELVLYGTYVLSGLAIGVGTLAGFKISGHACGCSGPLAMLATFVSPWFLAGYCLLPFIFWSSRCLGRHSAAQLLTGAALPVLAMVLCRVAFL